MFNRRHFLLLTTALLLSACKTSTTPTQPTPKQKPRAVIAVALGGGASKGFAHIGVLKVLHENNIPVNIVTGTSAGSIVGSLYAAGMSPARLQQVAAQLNKADVVDLTLSTKGFIKGEKLQNWVNTQVSNRPIERLPIKFAAVATEFGTGKMTVFNRGNTGQAVRASASIPNVFQPVQIGGKQYVDGGLSAPVPVSAAKKMGANFVIAVDISARPAKLDESSGFFSYLDQSLNIMSTAALNNELAKANVVIKPQVQQLGAIGGFDQKEQAILLGEKAAQAALPQIKAALSQYQY
ncbi:patatin-like phospholipase family protein [Kingella negevensis]|uniref:patatin-like phospholipase family protein n=1 Tax=Kingella negevensis TaxID=1522312 RepID=UPI002543592D|nr:patatin-like phospholipase family protein [Kingella negevensis]MDK4679240.1 patatin-like phospholipase family protein [Kingella negevensis]MDK4683038.1 patatin-like phospholipase family protein [Kingella negevensis]MDK4691238.1 patatin-like phospholipase family protein [Kingella negevensis]MDK4693614.1 patatin-like phospholipase family protein [Kingella negevensis]MDK4700430.1 patatin-like phospholipase family protein [Kingella negevensis]